MQVEDVVITMEEGLRSAACEIAMKLRQAGRSVDLVLESKKMKQVFKVFMTPQEHLPLHAIAMLWRSLLLILCVCG